ncbi:MAG: spore coat protein [Bacillota bacterium]|jgi:rubrerythrin
MSQQLSQKDLMYLTDHLDIEKQHVQKFQEAASQTTDPQCKQMYQDIANMHQRHFDTLSKHLSTGKMMS